MKITKVKVQGDNVKAYKAQHWKNIDNGHLKKSDDLAGDSINIAEHLEALNKGHGGDVFQKSFIDRLVKKPKNKETELYIFIKSLFNKIDTSKLEGLKVYLQKECEDGKKVEDLLKGMGRIIFEGKLLCVLNKIKNGQLDENDLNDIHDVLPPILVPFSMLVFVIVIYFNISVSDIFFIA